MSANGHLFAVLLLFFTAKFVTPIENDTLTNQITENDILTGTTPQLYIKESTTLTPSTRSTQYYNINVTSTAGTFKTTIQETPPNESDECPSLLGKEDYMDNLTQEQFTKLLTRECHYDKVVRPAGNEPLNVSVQIDLKHIEAVEQLQFRTHMLVQYRFTDARLAYDEISPNRGIVVGEETLRKKIWIPHVILNNEKEAQIMGLEGKDMFVTIMPKGEVTFSYRMTSTIYCWMNLKKFPFDTQTCEIMLRSWTYNASHLLLSWESEHPVKVATQLHLTEFSLKSYWTYSTNVTSGLSRSAFVGNYSGVVFKFQLEREIGYYLMDYYIPSIMIVCTSWVTFWLQADASAPRTTLGTSTMLTFITLASTQSKNLPKVSYIKASEIWFLGITVFIFLSMAEFAFVNIIWRRSKKVELKKKSSKYILKSTLTPSLARKQLQRSISNSTLQKSHSCSSLDGSMKGSSDSPHGYNNYLTVHSFPTIPTITTQSVDDLIPRGGNNNSQDNMGSTTIHVPDQEQNTAQKWTTMTPQEVAKWIDKRSRVVFPCAFIIFNILYWSFVYAL